MRVRNLQKYLLHTTTVCILWNDSIEIQLENHHNMVPIISISRTNLEESLQHDIHNYSPLSKKLKRAQVPYSELIGKLTASIESSHCEGFVVFQDDIPLFAPAFRNASTYSLWRSLKNKFIFASRRDIVQQDYYTDLLFHDQPNILIVEAQNAFSSTFDIKTNKFVGSLHDHPEKLYVLNRYYALNNTFERDELSTHKIANLKGREVVMGGFDYKPFTVVDFEKQPQVHDWAEDNPTQSVHIDGTEIRVLLSFCELYNCTVQFDTSEKVDWGQMYSNYTADGLKALMVNRKTQIAMNAMYTWLLDYIYFDLSTFLGRSGVTCLVPAPTRIGSWTLPLRPFGFTLWLAILACLIMEIISLLITKHIEGNLNGKDNSWNENFKFGAFTALRIFVSQGSQSASNSVTVRTVLFSCYMIDIVITSIYGGGLASILTVPILEEVADSVERLHKQKLIWTATSELWVAEGLRGAEDDPFVMDLVNQYRVHTFDEMREMAKAENMGFILERMMFGHFGNVDFLTPEALQRLKLMIDDIYFRYTVAVVPRLWPFLGHFNMHICNWHSSGLSKYWEFKIAAEYMNGNEQQQIHSSMKTNLDVGPVQLDMTNFLGILLIWMVGVSLSILGFCLEMLYFYWWQPKTTNTTDAIETNRGKRE